MAALLWHVQGDRAALGTVWRAGLRLWIPSLILTVGWVALYLAVVNQQRWSFDLAMTWDLLSRSITHGIVPGLAGGPWHWDRWAPASPWATPPPPVMTLGWLVLIGVLCGVAAPQTTHRAGVVDRGRLHRRLPGADLSDAVFEADRPGARPDPAVSARSRRRAGAAGRRRVERPQPIARVSRRLDASRPHAAW